MLKSFASSVSKMRSNLISW